MSNKASHHLFELIKSLNKSEKRYFKLFSGRHTIGEENGYLRLFDFIDRMDTYQEDLIFMHFKGQALLNKFSITKGRLYQNILRSLDSFHTNNSKEAQLYQQLHNAEILIGKGLYKQAERLLNSCEKQAQKYEMHHQLLIVHQKQKRLLEQELYAEVKAEQIEAMCNEEAQIIDEIATHQNLWKVKSLLFKNLNASGHVRNEEETKQLTALVKQVEKIDPNNYSIKSQYLYHHIHSAYYFAVGDIELSYHHLARNLKVLEENTSSFHNRPNIYFSVLTNLTYAATRLGKYNEAEEYLSKLKELSSKQKGKTNLDIDIKYFSSWCSLQLFLWTEKAEFSKAIELIPEIEEGYRLYGSRIHSLRKGYIDFKIGVSYFSLGEYNEALLWINKVLNEEKIDQKQDIYCFAQLINLLLHFELKNDRFLPYAINSTKRYFKNRNLIYKFEKIFLKMISQISKTEDVFDLEEKLAPLEKELIALKEDPREQVIFEYFDFLTWVQSKLLRKSFLTLKKEELNQ
jgi:hypothetical protein